MSRNPETTARLMAEAIEDEALGHYLMHSTFNPHKQYLSPHDFIPSEYKPGVRDRLREIKAYDEQIAEQGRARLKHAIKKAAKRDHSLSVVSSRVRKASARRPCHIALDTEGANRSAGPRHRTHRAVRPERGGTQARTSHPTH